MGLFGPPNIEKLKAKENVNGLIKALRNVQVRLSAVEALGDMNYAYKAGNSLTTLLNDNDKTVRLAAATALRKIRYPWCVGELVAALNDNDERLRREAALALGEIRDAWAVESLITTLNDNDKTVRREAAVALGKICDVRAVEPLNTALKDNDDLVRKEAAASLKEINRKTSKAHETKKDKIAGSYCNLCRDWSMEGDGTYFENSDLRKAVEKGFKPEHRGKASQMIGSMGASLVASWSNEILSEEIMSVKFGQHVCEECARNIKNIYNQVRTVYHPPYNLNKYICKRYNQQLKLTE